MTFVSYLKDKRFFIVFYVSIMVFVSLLILVSADEQERSENILYVNAGCATFAAVYMAGGYWRRKSYCLKLSEQMDSCAEDPLVSLPKPLTADHKLLYMFAKNVHNVHFKRLENLADEMREHREYIMSWIHEVKLPISASRLLMENSEWKDVEDVVDKLEDEISKIDDYVEQALYYSRIDSFSKDYFITATPLQPVIKESVKKYAKLFIAKRIRFVMEGSEYDVDTDNKWLSYVIDQLVSNALKYTSKGGNITAILEEDARERRLVIRDTGIGIKREEIRRVFEKGFTGSNGRSLAKSTGMGLYLAKRLALKLGHNLSVESEEGVYTQAIIHFPKIRSYLDLQSPGKRFHIDH